MTVSPPTRMRAKYLPDGALRPAAHAEDHRTEGPAPVWANAFRGGGPLDLFGDRLHLETAWLDVESRYASPNGALTYLCRPARRSRGIEARYRRVAAWAC